jgi:hypothetical protein
MNNETVSYNQETAAPAKKFVNWDASQTRLIAGINVPDSPLIAAVIEHAQRLSEPDRRAQLIWDLVALNSTPSLALHK